MSLLVENNLQVIEALKKIENTAQNNFALEGDKMESYKETFMDLIENTVRIIEHLQKKRDPDLISCQEICQEQLLQVIGELKLKSTNYFIAIYQNILNGRFKTFAF
jgi:esterase/lipase